MISTLFLLLFMALSIGVKVDFHRKIVVKYADFTFVKLFIKIISYRIFSRKQ